MRKRTRRLLFVLGGLLAIVLAAWLYLRVQLHRIEADALRLAKTGRAAIALFKETAAAVAEGDRNRLAARLADDYRHEAQGPWRERLAFEGHGITVNRWEEGAPRPCDKACALTLFTPLTEPAAEVTQSKFKLSLVEAMPAPDRAAARGVLWLRGNRKDGLLFETQLELRVWMRAAEEGWQIEKMALLDGVTVLGEGAGFTDAAAQAELTFRARRNPMFATEAWRPERFEIFKYSSAGVSAADFDDDGWEDLLFADGASLALYRNRGDGTFEDATAAAGLPVDQPGVNAAVFADLDNDGDQDLLLAGLTVESMLFVNDGGVFRKVVPPGGLGGPLAATAAVADYDNDGDLDLYLGRYLDPRVDLPTTLFYTRNGAGNSLWRNDGDWRFTDVTEEAGVREGGLTLAVAWADYDEDGDQDLYVANDFGRNALLRNRGDGTFEDVSEASGTLDFGFGMSATFGDIDNDGDLDLYTSNVHSGQRWYGQAATLYQYLGNSLRQGTLMADYPIYREILDLMGSDWRDYGDRMVKGNSLLQNNGDGSFTDVAEIANANPFGWYWGSTFFDYDNDGRQDIFAANGWITAPSKDDL